MLLPRSDYKKLILVAGFGIDDDDDLTAEEAEKEVEKWRQHCAEFPLPDHLRQFERNPYMRDIDVSVQNIHVCKTCSHVSRRSLLQHRWTPARSACGFIKTVLTFATRLRKLGSCWMLSETLIC